MDKRFDSDSWNDTGKNLYGCLKQLYLQKKRNRNLNVLLSIGGWTYSESFQKPMSSAQGRETFAKSAVSLLKDLPFDGIDIDWEYPSSPQEGDNLAALLAVCRLELDKYADSFGPGPIPHFLLTAASPASLVKVTNLPLRKMDKYLDFWNLMTYDFAGSWDELSGHQANIFKSKESPRATPFDSNSAVQYYVGQGVAHHKIILGMPLYGRAFLDTEGPGFPFNTVGEGSWENGVWDFKVSFHRIDIYRRLH